MEGPIPLSELILVTLIVSHSLSDHFLVPTLGASSSSVDLARGCESSFNGKQLQQTLEALHEGISTSGIGIVEKMNSPLLVARSRFHMKPEICTVSTWRYLERLLNVLHVLT